MTLRAIWAQSRSRVIGADGGMPWHVPEDLAYFKKATMTAPVIMGRRTWQSFPDAFRPLPGRANIVLSRDPDFAATGADVVDSLDAALEKASDVSSDAWIIGGATLYARTLDLLDEVWVTEIDVDVAGDALAPELGSEWERASADPGASDWHISRTGTRYRFVVYRRR